MPYKYFNITLKSNNAVIFYFLTNRVSHLISHDAILSCILSQVYQLWELMKKNKHREFLTDFINNSLCS